MNKYILLTVLLGCLSYMLSGLSKAGFNTLYLPGLISVLGILLGATNLFLAISCSKFYNGMEKVFLLVGTILSVITFREMWGKDAFFFLQFVLLIICISGTVKFGLLKISKNKLKQHNQ